MVTDALINAVFGGLNALLSLAPNWTLSPPAYESGYLNIVYDFNKIVPIGDVVSALGIVLGLRVALQAWDFLVFVYHQFWGGD